MEIKEKYTKLIKRNFPLDREHSHNIPILYFKRIVQKFEFWSFIQQAQLFSRYCKKPL